MGAPSGGPPPPLGEVTQGPEFKSQGSTPVLPFFFCHIRGSVSFVLIINDGNYSSQFS